LKNASTKFWNALQHLEEKYKAIHELQCDVAGLIAVYEEVHGLPPHLEREAFVDFTQIQVHLNRKHNQAERDRWPLNMFVPSQLLAEGPVIHGGVLFP
jgi:hypothetical protein